MKLIVFWALIASLLASCASNLNSSNQGRTPIQKLLDRKATIGVDFTTSPEGLLILEIDLSDSTEKFILDTGATLSAIFDEKNRNFVYESTDSFANVHGLTNSGEFPIIKLQSVSIGDLILKELPVAVLTEEDHAGEDIGVMGVLGMDAIQGYNLFLDYDAGKISLLPQSYPEATFENNWTPVKLYPNPYGLLNRDLHFFDVRIGNHIVPAILDSGAEFNVINWDASMIPDIRRMRRRLRQDWEVTGAVGEFDPTVQISVSDMRAGQKSWEMQKFIVMDFDHFDPIGFKDKALVIAGIGLLSEKQIFMDFKNDVMWFNDGGETRLPPIESN